MNILKFILHLAVKIIIAFLLAIFLYFFSAFILTFIPVNSNYKESDNGNNIFVSTNGVHTNIILPSKSKYFNWNEFLNLKSECKYIAFGWGDEEFYLNTPTWDKLKFSTAFKAGFSPTKTIMQTYIIKYEPVTNKSTIKISLTDKQFNEITNFVKSSFILNSNKSVIKIEPNNNFYSKAYFYKAVGRYSIFNTCNNWTNRGLKKAGIKNSVWTPFDISVMHYIKK
ncbi:MAG: DUF2459 domain-containing protein [Bacteroidales bacterium]|nr:DUF2459 domain-containing protein [Bacteroidales bacterium]MBN2758348.1 DUF2459 domain-containing protein [Bacteroidales bacterium]